MQALNTLRELIGFDSVPRDYDIVGQLAYQPDDSDIGGAESEGASLAPDLQAAQRGVTAAQSQIGLAKAKSKQDLNATFDYSHVSASQPVRLLLQHPAPYLQPQSGRSGAHLLRADPVAIAGEGCRAAGAHGREECLRNAAEQP